MSLIPRTQSKSLYILMRPYSAFGDVGTTTLAQKVVRALEPDTKSMVRSHAPVVRVLTEATEKYGIQVSLPNALLTEVLSLDVANNTLKISVPAHQDIDPVIDLLKTDHEIEWVSSNVYEVKSVYEHSHNGSKASKKTTVFTHKPPERMPKNSGLFLVPQVRG